MVRAQRWKDFEGRMILLKIKYHDQIFSYWRPRNQMRARENHDEKEYYRRTSILVG